MLRFAAIVALLLASTFRGISEQPASEQGKPPLKFDIGIWKVPPGFISTADPSDKNGTRAPLPGFKTKENPNALQFDASEFLKSLGLEFPSGSEAVYDQNSSMLVVRNSRENLEIFDSVLSSCGLGFFPFFQNLNRECFFQ